MRTFAFVVILATSTLGTGCATMFTDARQRVELVTYPQDAVTTVDGEVVPPGPVDLERDKTHIIEVQKPGFETRRIQMKQELNGWFLVNLLWGPFFWVGMLVDAMTGTIQELSPGRLTVNLDPLDPKAPRIASTSPPPPPAGGPSVDPEPATSPPPPPPPPPPLAPPAVERKRPPTTMANANQQAWVLAVMDTQLSGSKTAFDRTMLIALTDQIRVFLASRHMRVIDRSSQEAAMGSILAEEKRASYKTCVDSSCQIPLGKALAASHIMRSSVAKFGQACATNGELVDLRTEVTVAAGSARSGCAEEDLLYAAELLAEQLVVGSATAK